MSEKIIDELQKLYDNDRIGDLVQEICEYYVTRNSYLDGSYENEIEPPEIMESSYILFCLQCREQILDELMLVKRKYPSVYSAISDFHNTLLINMDYRSLEKEKAKVIAGFVKGTTADEVLRQIESNCLSSKNLSKGLDKFFSWIHSENH